MVQGLTGGGKRRTQLVKEILEELNLDKEFEEYTAINNYERANFSRKGLQAILDKLKGCQE